MMIEISKVELWRLVTFVFTVTGSANLELLIFSEKIDVLS